MWNYRNLKPLTKTQIFIDFVKEYNLQVYMVNGCIILYNGCIYIYSFIIEDYIYFSFYDMENTRFCPNISLMNEGLNIDRKSIYSFVKSTHTKKILNYNDNDLKIEQLFFTEIESYRIFYKKLLLCCFDEYKKYFESMRDIDVEKFRHLLNDAEPISID